MNGALWTFFKYIKLKVNMFWTVFYWKSLLDKLDNEFILDNITLWLTWNAKNYLKPVKSLRLVDSVTAQKKWSFPLRISPVNVIISAGTCGFGHIYWRNP